MSSVAEAECSCDPKHKHNFKIIFTNNYLSKLNNIKHAKEIVENEASESCWCSARV